MRALNDDDKYLGIIIDATALKNEQNDPIALKFKEIKDKVRIKTC